MAGICGDSPRIVEAVFNVVRDSYVAQPSTKKSVRDAEPSERPSNQFVFDAANWPNYLGNLGVIFSPFLD